MEKQDNNETTKKKKNRIVSFIQTILIILMIVFNGIIITNAIRHPNKTPDFLGIRGFIILSGSMEPNIKVGDMVIVKEEPSVKERRYSSL